MFPLLGQFSLEILGFDLLKVFAGTVPVFVEDQALVVFSLGKDSSPGIQEGGCVGHGL